MTIEDLIKKATKDKIRKERIGSRIVRYDLESLDLGSLATSGRGIKIGELTGYLNNVPNKNNERKPKY